jgi:hypothetical protein
VSATSYQYTGATVASYYYKITITVSNTSGSASQTTSVIQNVLPWTPTTPLARLAAWFDGTRGVTSGSWTNYGSGTGNTSMASVSPVYQPFTTTTVNGLQAVNINDSCGFFTLVHTAPSRSCFMVTKQTAINTTNSGLAIATDSNYTATGFYSELICTGGTVPNTGLRSRTGVPGFATVFVQGAKANTSPPQTNQTLLPSLWGVNASNASTSLNRIYVNNTAITPSTSNICTGLDPTAIYTVPYNSFRIVTMCEILMYDGELTTLDMTNIVSYLTTRWGVPVL